MTKDESEMRRAWEERKRRQSLNQLEATKDDYDDGDGRCVGLVVMAWCVLVAVVGAVAFVMIGGE